MSQQSKILSWLILADAAWTVYVVSTGKALEANPIMAYFLSYSILLFVAVKIITLMALVIALEFVHYKQMKNAHRWSNVALVSFVLVYLIGVMGVN